jgi:hypothetical protein
MSGASKLDATERRRATERELSQGEIKMRAAVLYSFNEPFKVENDAAADHHRP